MNRENVAKWADELQFGDHKQAFHTLHSNSLDDDGDSYHCALGVAHVVQAAERSFLVPSLKHLAWKLDIVNVALWRSWLGLTEDQRNLIVDMNDEDHMTLPQIGAWVRDNWLKEE